jgi:transposase
VKAFVVLTIGSNAILLTFYVIADLSGALGGGLDKWPAAGFVDTEIKCFMNPKVANWKTTVWREFKIEAGCLIKDHGVSAAQASCDLDVHENVRRKWVRDFAADPAQAFSGHEQMKPEQLEIEKLRREVAKLKAACDILKKAAAYLTKDMT